MNGRRKDSTMRPEDENKVVKFFKQDDPKFIEACSAAGVKVTKRQVSKWLKGTGLAFRKMKGEL